MQNDDLGSRYRESDTFRVEPMREATDAERSLMNITKQQASNLKDIIMSQPASRERSAALTKLEEAVFWATKGIMS